VDGVPREHAGAERFRIRVEQPVALSPHICGLDSGIVEYYFKESEEGLR
jgi:hypothetical protein